MRKLNFENIFSTNIDFVARGASGEENQHIDGGNWESFGGVEIFLYQQDRSINA